MEQRGLSIDSHMSIGDDIVIASNQKITIDDLAARAMEVNSPVSVDKSYYGAHFNRRV